MLNATKAAPLSFGASNIIKPPAHPLKKVTGEELERLKLQASELPPPPSVEEDIAQLKKQDAWKVASVIRVNGKIAVIKYQDAGTQLHGPGTRLVHLIRDQQLNGQNSEAITKRLEKELKSTYGASVKVERFNSENAPTSGDLQIEMYGKRYIDDLSHLYKGEKKDENLKKSVEFALRGPQVSTEFFLALREISS